MHDIKYDNYMGSNTEKKPEPLLKKTATQI